MRRLLNASLRLVSANHVRIRDPQPLTREDQIGVANALVAYALVAYEVVDRAAKRLGDAAHRLNTCPGGHDGERRVFVRRE
jgi:hypothetical protein